MHRESSALRRAAALRQTLRRSSRPLAGRGRGTPVTNSPTLGCTILRRVSDAGGQQWLVRELTARDSTSTLVFQHADRDAEVEIRRTRKTLGEMWDGDLVALLRFGA